MTDTTTVAEHGVGALRRQPQTRFAACCSRRAATTCVCASPFSLADAPA